MTNNYEIEIIRPKAEWSFFRITTQFLTRHKAEQAMVAARACLKASESLLRKQNFCGRINALWGKPHRFLLRF